MCSTAYSVIGFESFKDSSKDEQGVVKVHMKFTALLHRPQQAKGDDGKKVDSRTVLQKIHNFIVVKRMIVGDRSIRFLKVIAQDLREMCDRDRTCKKNSMTELHYPF
jgi:hypothetical protein